MKTRGIKQISPEGETVYSSQPTVGVTKSEGPNAMHPHAGMTHLVILLTIVPLANSAIYHLPDNQKLPFSGAETMGIKDADRGKVR